jgi:hypothetical protein
LGCTAEEPARDLTEGRAALHIELAGAVGDITRVTVQAADRSAELVFDSVGNSYDGTIVLPSGAQTLVARAFAEDTLVGASEPLPIEVQAGTITPVTIRILDLTSEPSSYQPVFQSLMFPTTVAQGARATFSISVIAPDGDPITYAWSSSCAESAFSDPAAATTDWSSPSEGTCTIDVVVQSDGFQVAQRFSITVLSSGQPPSGGVDVTGVFVPRPRAQFTVSTVDCLAPNEDLLCKSAISSPDAGAYQVTVFDWGALPGAIELSDSCGGRFGTFARTFDGVRGFWRPSVQAGVCLLTARVTNSAGVVSTLAPAVIVRDGVSPTAQAPSINSTLRIPGNGACSLRSSTPTAACGSTRSGQIVSLSLSFSPGDHEGSVVVTDDCAGPLPQADGVFSMAWAVPAIAPRTCTVTIQVTNLAGLTGQASGQYQITGP